MTQEASQQVVNQYNKLRQEQNKILSVIGDLENESHEHDLVIAELEKLDGSRCCHRLVGGVLVERTVADVLPQLKENTASIKKTLDELNAQLKAKESEIENFIATNGLRTAKPSEAASVKGGDERGVLV
ncbi:hypothetical protein AGDE_05283 [Angomonas deanei]|uniref:Prefoldin subunit, putative n=1 Tax=Angomonas deanei TaxID=59799 RepID=A0A7G2CK01_9TRYP|nr:hypothetical protein AGDE_05283 [Angomonas deanei]CAD2219271.1 Prefoldin subunit, putative [Angomonas deanei]|eukprot:EPY38646.1 hypothetical protein AGDE_05283 [Angomonas deanei]